MVAHRLSTIRKADRILVLDQGRIIEAGTHDMLMQKKGFYFRLNHQQTCIGPECLGPEVGTSEDKKVSV